MLDFNIGQRLPQFGDGRIRDRRCSPEIERPQSWQCREVTYTCVVGSRSLKLHVTQLIQLFQVPESFARDKRAFKMKPSQSSEFAQMSESAVRDLRAGDVDRFKIRKCAQIPEPRIGDLRVDQHEVSDAGQFRHALQRRVVNPSSVQVEILRLSGRMFLVENPAQRLRPTRHRIDGVIHVLGIVEFLAGLNRGLLSVSQLPTSQSDRHDEQGHCRQTQPERPLVVRNWTTTGVNGSDVHAITLLQEIVRLHPPHVRVVMQFER